MHPTTAALRRAPAFSQLAAKAPQLGQLLRVGGASGSLPMVTVAALAQCWPNRLWTVVATPRTAQELHGDLETLLGEDVAVHFPQREEASSDGDDDSAELSGYRVEAVEAFLAGWARVLVATQHALEEVTPIPNNLGDLRLTVATGDHLGHDTLIQALEERGFVRTPMVEQVGTYAVRGGLIDLFSFGAAGPARIEFWGDEVESIRLFDILDQRSTDTVARVDLLPVAFTASVGAAPSLSRSSLLNHLPQDTILVLVGDDSVATAAAAASFARHPRIAFEAEPVGDIVFSSLPPPPIERSPKKLRSFLKSAAREKAETLILCDNDGQASRLHELVEDRKGHPPAGCHLLVGSISGGFRLRDSEPALNVLTDHELFRRGRKVQRRRRFRGAASLESLAQLSPGDYVVHMEHGIGCFRGLERVTVGSQSLEVLVIAYDGDELLRLPVHRLDQIERWVGGDPEAVPKQIHRIGGKRWKALRRKTEGAINRMTAELLELYAARQARSGFAFSPDNRWQQEMEASFLYEDTPDQRAAVASIKEDMESPRVMDRLICGDVGYGKTEVAVRAAFKAVQDGKQVAVLAPTTVLVAQHAKTFGDRLADYPVLISSLSRFDSARSQREILLELSAGEVDIVIGTHRLLSKDVRFNNLGLVIVDEEQRLGVRHKERLKRFRTTVDVLTLTATPIPRTLYLSLTGIRDLSLIRTPPRDRLPIVTHVVGWHDRLVTEACQREIDRGGQVFFLHNRVETIDTARERMARLLPGRTVELAHGQMTPGQLDSAMTAFVSGDTDVLVCSSIIENGLDVPNANTLIVDRADRFGLSQLYQIRGRVGRSDRRAYCYLIVPETVSSDAERRLQVLEHYTELGSGYHIALRDLEVRGAGNLLGEDQSGFAHAVGIDTYMRLLEQAVKRMQNQSERSEYPPPEVRMDSGAYLPDAYVPDRNQKLHIYRRLSRAKKREDVAELESELLDRFGRLPAEARRLLEQTKLRLAGQQAGAARILLSGDQARVNFRSEVVPRMSALEEHLDADGLQVEVRRVVPLSVIFKYGVRERLTELVVDAIYALSGSQITASK